LLGDHSPRSPDYPAQTAHFLDQNLPHPRRIVPSGLDDNRPEDHPDIIAAELRSFFQAEQFA